MSSNTPTQGQGGRPLEGKLGAVSLIEVLSNLAEKRLSGILTVQGERDIVAMSFLHGSLVSTDALNQSVEEGLGDFLVGQNLVRPSDFAQVLEEQRKTGARLVDLLADRGLIERGTLLNALRQMIYHSALRVLDWKKGDFKFYPADEVTFESGIEPIAVDEFLVRATRDLGREGPLAASLAHSSEVFEREGTGDTNAGVSGRGPHTLKADDLDLLKKIDGKRSVEELQSELSWSEHRLLYRLQELERAGIIRRRELPEPEPEPEAEVEIPEAPLEAGFELTGYSFAAETEEAQVVGHESHVGALILALVALVVLVAGLALSTSALLLPYPWQEGQAVRLSGVALRAAHLKVDRAAKTYYLLHGRFPANLAVLVSDGLLGKSDLVDPRGFALTFHASNDSYELVRSESTPGSETTREAITGNFLLDPQFAGKSKQPQVPPLVLLD